MTLTPAQQESQAIVGAVASAMIDNQTYRYHCFIVKEEGVVYLHIETNVLKNGKIATLEARLAFTVVAIMHARVPEDIVGSQIKKVMEQFKNKRCYLLTEGAAGLSFGGRK